jgi:deazaflavin-dependent oxidoreductase (nitroreductase family)
MPVEQKELSWNERMIAELRANGGKSAVPHFVNSDLLILTATGAKTGKPRSYPLGYTRDGEKYVVVGSNSGGPDAPGWLINIRANPIVTVEAYGETFQARAAVTEGAERRRLLDAHQAAIPIFRKYEQMTEGIRELQVVTLERLTED